MTVGSNDYLKHAIEAALMPTHLGGREPPESATAHFDTKCFRDLYYETYFFLFRKNLTNSDIPFGELRSLLQLHITGDDGARLPIQFDNIKNIAVALKNICAAIPASYGEATALLAEAFHDFLSYSIAVDALYGSCVVHVPRSLRIDLERIVGESGYVYSAGRAIFVRRTQKATKSLFRRNLSRYLKSAKIDPQNKLAFLINSPQHFPIGEFNQEVASQLRHGLDDVKMSLDKFFFEDVPLYDFRAQLSEDPEFSPYLKFVDIEHGRYDPLASGTDPSRSIWLIAEQEIGTLEIRRARERYFACFVQEFVNRNQLHLFNERKPGWISPITLPQTLAGAMINLARPYLRKPTKDEDGLKVLDPFAGMGTMLLEALKLDLPATYYVNDLNSFDETVILDNLRFFAASREQLHRLRCQVQDIVVYLNSSDGEAIFKPSFTPRPLLPDRPETMLHIAIAQYRTEVEQYQEGKHPSAGVIPVLEYARGMHSHTFSDSLVRHFANWRFEQRVVFYIVWRALIRNTFTLVNDSNHAKIGQRVLCEDFGLFEYELKILLRDCYGGPLKGGKAGCLSALGRYSKSVIINPDTFSRAFTETGFAEYVHWSCMDVNELLEKFGTDGTRFDLIATDPPYGINAMEGAESAAALIKLYSKFLTLAVQVLRDGGQLLLCVPENTHNGQRIPAYMSRDIVVREILISAAKAGMQMVNPAIDSPFPVDIFRPPFYWESERTLRRAILHFIGRRNIV